MKAYILLAFGVGQIPDGVKFCSSIPGVIEVTMLWGVFDAIAKVDADSLEPVVHQIREFGGLLSTQCLPIKDD